MSRVFTLILSLCFIFSGSVYASSSNYLKVNVNGEFILFNEEIGFPYIDKTGRTLIPMRACLEAIDCQVQWDQESKQVVTRKDNTEIIIPIGKSQIIVNGISQPNETPAIIFNSRTYIPIRTVLELYGYKVDWDSNTRTIFIKEGDNSSTLIPSQINGGKTGVFSRKQLNFHGFDGIEADITLPLITALEKGDGPLCLFWL